VPGKRGTGPPGLLSAVPFLLYNFKRIQTQHNPLHQPCRFYADEGGMASKADVPEREIDSDTRRIQSPDAARPVLRPQQVARRPDRTRLVEREAL
jgi:hypothetical protein